MTNPTAPSDTSGTFSVGIPPRPFAHRDALHERNFREALSGFAAEDVAALIARRRGAAGRPTPHSGESAASPGTTAGVIFGDVAEATRELLAITRAKVAARRKEFP